MPEPALQQAADVGDLGRAGLYHATMTSSLPPQQFDAPAIGLLAKGAYEDPLQSCGARYEGPAVIIYTPGQEAAVDFQAADNQFFWIRCSPEWRDWVERQSPRTLLIRRGGAWLRAMHFYAKAKADILFSRDHTEELVIDLLWDAGLVRPARRIRRGPWLSLVLDQLHSNNLGPVSLSGVAADIGMHPAHLARAFKAQVGCSLGQYQRRIRLQTIAGELGSGRKTVVELAHRHGFSDQSHLCKQFRHYFGMPPATYRCRSQRDLL